MTFSTIKHFLIGKPFPTSMDIHERLDKVRALAVFASDPISSNAYATESIMSVLIVLGSQSLGLTLPIGLAVAGLVLIVIFSYIQTIMHYPDGGGAYTVAKDNLGQFPSLLAAAALLTDYILTVSVSVSAGVKAVTSAFPQTFDYRVHMALIAILFITWMNLRGVRESGTVFAIPTYAFVLGGLITIAIGFARQLQLFGLAPLPVLAHAVPAAASPIGFAYIWLLLRAFSGGCTALTGIEAISNGVQAFKPPEPKNAVKTMLAMGIMAMALFVGITFLSTHMHLVPNETESILSQMTREITGRSVVYYWVQFFTAGILFLAANTAYQDFPRLSSFLAKDRFMPSWMQNRGDRLVFSYGIAALAFIASIIIVIFQANEIAMLPLYALGVMLSFSLSQAGMFHLMGRISHLKPGEALHTMVTKIHYESGVRWKRAVNAFGAIITFLVFITLMSTKFMDGAWIVVLIIPIAIVIFYSIHHHYKNLANQLSLENHDETSLIHHNRVVMPIGGVHRGTLKALRFARTLSHDVTAVHISIDPLETDKIKAKWDMWGDGYRLIIIHSPYRLFLEPLLNYVDRIEEVCHEGDEITIVVPQFIPKNPLSRALHTRTAETLRKALLRRENIVITEVPYQVK
jgi:amino acid transporter